MAKDREILSYRLMHDMAIADAGFLRPSTWGLSKDFRADPYCRQGITSPPIHLCSTSGTATEPSSRW